MMIEKEQTKGNKLSTAMNLYNFMKSQRRRNEAFMIKLTHQRRALASKELNMRCENN
jgi:hypothetical protein